MKPVAESCLRNQEPIFQVLEPLLCGRQVRLLELGSGTGQHAVYLAARLPDTNWQPSDVPECLPGIRAWVDEAGLRNVMPPLAIDVDHCADHPLLDGSYDVVFMANTLHFVSDATAENFVRAAIKALRPGGQLMVYGPFNTRGHPVGEGNQRLQAWLKQRDPASGIKETGWLIEQVSRQAPAEYQCFPMPANNHLFVFQSN